MDNTELFLTGLQCFLSQHANVSQALQQKILSLKQSWLQIDDKLTQFSVAPFVNRSAVDLEFVREKAIMTINLTDENANDIKITGRINSENFQSIDLGELNEEKLQNIIKQFNRKYGHVFYDESKANITIEEHTKTQKIKAATRTFLDDHNIAGIGITTNEIIFYLIQKVSKKKLKELYPETIENIPVIFKQTGVFLP